MAGDTEEDIFNNDIDPLEGIRQLRKQEDSEIEVSPELDEAADEAALDAVVDEVVDELDEVEDEAPAEEADPAPEDTADEPDTELPVPTKENSGKEPDKQSALGLGDKRKFKANGQEFEFTVEEMLEQFGSVFGQSMDYTKKTQKLAPFRKMISALEEQNVSEEQLNLALDALKGDKGAIKQLLENNKLESYDLSDDDDNGKQPYTPTQYGQDESTLNLKEVVDSIASDPEYSTTVDVVQNQWDSGSQNQLASNPNLLQGLHNDVKTGVYAQVAPEAMKLKILDGNTKSDIEYYMLAGQQLGTKTKSGSDQTNVDELNKKTQSAVANSDKASSEAKRKRSASSTATRSDRTVTDYLDDDNDEAFDDWYKKVTSS